MTESTVEPSGEVSTGATDLGCARRRDRASTARPVWGSGAVEIQKFAKQRLRYFAPFGFALILHPQAARRAVVLGRARHNVLG